MIFGKIFMNSIKLPKKQAVFQLNRIGMDYTVFYLFLLLGVVCLPLLIDTLTETTGLTSRMNSVFRLIYFFIFSYLPLTIIVFILLSAIAYIGTWIARLMHRKLKFPLLWKMSAYSTTIPFIVYTIVALFFPIRNQIIWLLMLYALLLLIKIITVFPKRRKRA